MAVVLLRYTCLIEKLFRILAPAALLRVALRQLVGKVVPGATSLQTDDLLGALFLFSIVHVLITLVLLSNRTCLSNEPTCSGLTPKSGPRVISRQIFARQQV